MKRLFLLVTTVVTIFISGCQNKMISKNDFNLNEIGLKHNVVLNDNMNELRTKKDGSSLQDIYNMTLKSMKDNYNITDVNLSFNEFKNIASEIKDSNTDLIEIYKKINPQFTHDEIMYLIQLKEVINQNLDTLSTRKNIEQIENEIILNNSLTKEKKLALLNGTDIAINSYKYWHLYKSQLKNSSTEPGWEWIILADAVGGIGGCFLGGFGTILLLTVTFSTVTAGIVGA